MKKVLVFILFLSLSCEPDENRCWKCNIYCKENMNRIAETFTWCGVTERFIDNKMNEWEEAGLSYGCSAINEPKSW